MGIIKTDAEFHASDNQLKLDDTYYGTVGPDAGKAILTNGIPKLGPDWRPIPDTHTTPAQELGALPQNFANVMGAIAGLTELVKQLAAGQGIPLDLDKWTDAVASKTADELAKRLTGQENN